MAKANTKRCSRCGKPLPIHQASGLTYAQVLANGDRVCPTQTPCKPAAKRKPRR